MKFLSQSSTFTSVFLTLILSSPVARADELSDMKRALDIIENFATAFCIKPELRGTNSSQELQAKVGIEANALIKKITGLKLEVGGKIQTQQYDGLLQKDLLSALHDTTTCKVNLFDQLKDQILPKRKLESGEKKEVLNIHIEAGNVKFGRAEQSTGYNWQVNFVLKLKNPNQFGVICQIYTECGKYKKDDNTLMEQYQTRNQSTFIGFAEQSEVSGLLYCGGYTDDVGQIGIKMTNKTCTER